MKQTPIISVLKESGWRAYCPRHPNASLMEVQQGDHEGKRGCDACLFDLVGPIHWDKNYASIHETCKIVSFWEFLYEAYELEREDSFTGGYVETVIVSKRTGIVLAHLRGYHNPSVVSDWEPKRQGFCGKAWEKVREPGYSMCRDQQKVIAWAWDILDGWW